LKVLEKITCFTPFAGRKDRKTQRFFRAHPVCLLIIINKQLIVKYIRRLNIKAAKNAKEREENKKEIPVFDRGFRQTSNSNHIKQLEKIRGQANWNPLRQDNKWFSVKFSWPSGRFFEAQGSFPTTPDSFPRDPGSSLRGLGSGAG
jgi:hypothetical protein